MGRFSQKLLLSTYLMNISVSYLLHWFFLALRLFYWSICFWRHLFWCGCPYFAHEFLLFFFLFGLILIRFKLFSFFLFVGVFRLGLSKIAIKLIPSRTALLIVLILFFVLNVSEKVLSLILPERIFFFLLFPVHEVVHFSTPSLPKAHLLDCVVFGRQWLWWLLLITVFLVGPWLIVWALFLVVILWEFLVLVVF